MGETPKRRWPQADAMAVAECLYAQLLPVCERVAIAGSLRRGKPDVGDVELLFIPRLVTQANPADLFAEMRVDLAEGVIAEWLDSGVLTKRPSADGRVAWGPKNKLAVHAATGIPVDLFTATPANWWNYLVCRTGPADSNMQIATAAQRRGWKWNPYGPGFSRGGRDDQDYEEHVVTCEVDVFRFAGLPVPKWLTMPEEHKTAVEMICEATDRKCCPRCRCCEMFWEECEQCGGEGESEPGELYSEDPMYYDKEDTRPCDACCGDGGHWYCSCNEHGKHEQTGEGGRNAS